MNLGRYEILEEIGRGSMGVVYKAHDPNLDLIVALKVLREDRLADEAVARRFLAEAKALGRLEHPNTVRVYNVDREGGTVYIAMEFVEGESLSARMKRERLSVGEIVEVGTAVAGALGDAHSKGVVHRDVKPGNILVRSDGRVKITDFGIAHIDDVPQDDRTRAGEILGTPGYMSPEQVRGEPVDGRSDLFSLGIILYELAVGAKPFAADTLAAVFYAITQKNPDSPDQLNPDIPRGLAQAILKCLAKTPEQRFQSAEALAAALRLALPVEAPTSEAARPAAGASRALWAASAVGALLLAGAALLYSRSGVPVGSAPPPAAASVLKVESEPPGAQLFVDGGFQGKTPAGLTLRAGKHEVRVILAGFQDWEAQVQLAEKAETPLRVQLAPVDQGAGAK